MINKILITSLLLSWIIFMLSAAALVYFGRIQGVEVVFFSSMFVALSSGSLMLLTGIYKMWTTDDYF